MTAPVASGLVELIGNTPLVRVRCFDTGDSELWLKLESHNPGGSIKDRIGLSMITAAEEAGRLARGGHIVEATAGNTGLGLALVAALRGCRDRKAPCKVVTFVCDSGAKYLSKAYRDEWLADQGLVPREAFGDLRDVVARRSGQLVDVAPDDPLRSAYARMRLHDVSQLPVRERGVLVGIVDESDLLVASLAGSFDRPVRDVMTTKVETLPPSASIQDLVGVLDRGLVGVIVDKGALFGIVTRIDLVNYLRRRIV